MSRCADKALRRIETLKLALRALGIAPEMDEYRFHPQRQWRFDLAWPSLMIAVEIDGGEWLSRGGRAVGRHAHAADYEKLNEATIMGWRILRFTGSQVDQDPTACAEMIARAIASCRKP